MKKGRIIVFAAVACVIAVVIGNFFFGSDGKKEGVYHIILADPDLYKEGIFADTFEIQKGDYQFRFTPNGDSPKTLSIKLEGDSFSFSEEFELVGTPHDTGLSVYYTWDYLGPKEIRIDEEEELRIEVNPHDNLQGPVSIEIIKLILENKGA